MENILEKEWVLEHLHDPKIRIVDCRFSLAGPEKGRKEYTKGHIPGAVYFDLEKDLSGPVQTHGGRHPLPYIAEFVQKLEKAGIDNKTTIVAYDNGEGAFAARFWWLLKYLGHEKTYVLNGGFKKWTEVNYPTTTEIRTYPKTYFPFQLRPELIASIDEVKVMVNSNDSNIVLIDSREEKRYLGIEEPIDKKAGHIPGAINKPWLHGFQNGNYHSVVDQQIRFSDVDREKQIIVYCGSGVTAAPNFLALKEAGFTKVKLYVGSFSDWISYKENFIE